MARRDLKIYVSTDSRGTVRANARATRSFDLLKGSAIAAGGVLAGGLAIGAKKAFDEFRQSEKATNQTIAALKSTHHQAKVTAKEIENLANAISLKSGIDDEAIQSGENLLLTFTKIRDEQGRGNKIFSQATQVITDMSVALDQDLKSSAIQVGKALQDPEKGITALRRVGVNFTQTQSDMISNWVAHGKQLKAQKFILKELTTEFGGSAAAQADSSDKLKVAWDNLFESIGKAFGPLVERAAGKLAKFINQMQTGKGAGGRFADRMKDLADAAKDVGSVIGPPLKAIGEFAVKHPKVAAMAAAVGALAVGMGKLRGGSGGGKLGSIGQAVGLMKPVPVFVTNPGFGGGGGKPGGKLPPIVTTAGKDALKAGAGLRWIRLGMAGGVPILGLTYLASHFNRDRPTSAAEARARGGAAGERAFNRRTSQGSPSAGVPAIPGSEGTDARQKARLEASKKQHADWARHIRRSTEAVSEAYERTGSIQTSVMSKSGRKLSDLRMHTARETQRIKTRFSEDTDKGREALARNYRRAADAARSQMRSAGGVTQSGLRFIRRMMVEELKIYGLSKESIRFRLEGKEQSGKTIDAPLVGKQSGGMVVPGSGGGDKVLMQAMVEPNEQVFVLNRNASSALSSLQRLNSMVPRFARGGLMGMIGAANRLERAHFPYVWGGGHQGSPAPFGPMDCSGAVSYVLQQGGVKIPTMVSGALANAGLPGPGNVTVFANAGHTFMRIGKRFFGTSGSNPGGGAGWMPDPGAGYRAGFVQRHFRATGSPGISRARVGGPDSPVRSVAQGALDKIRGAARHRLNALMSTPIGFGDPGDSGPGGSAANRRLGQRMAARFGWGRGAQWRSLDDLWGRLEGRWDENLFNLAGSGAYGIAQALPASKYPSAGEPTAPAGPAKAAAQIGWGLNYIKGRYGDPLHAHAFRVSSGYYQRGGLVGRQTGGSLGNLTSFISPYVSTLYPDAGYPRKAGYANASDYMIRDISRAIGLQDTRVGNLQRLQALSDEDLDTPAGRAARATELLTLGRAQFRSFSLNRVAFDRARGTRISARARVNRLRRMVRRSNTKKERRALRARLKHLRRLLSHTKGRRARHHIRAQIRTLERTLGARGQIGGAREDFGTATEDLDTARASVQSSALDVAETLGERTALLGQTGGDTALELNNRLLEEHNAISRELVDNQKRLLAMKDQGDFILASVISAIEGGIGGKVGIGFNLPATAGVPAVYR